MATAHVGGAARNRARLESFAEIFDDFLLTYQPGWCIISFVVKRQCASGSAVEHHLAKVGVAGSIPVSRFFFLRFFN